MIQPRLLVPLPKLVAAAAAALEEFVDRPTAWITERGVKRKEGRIGGGEGGEAAVAVVLGVVVEGAVKGVREAGVVYTA